MGVISVTFVAVCTCIFLASQVLQTESRSRRDDRSSSSINGDNGDLSPEQRNVRIDGYVRDKSHITFNSSQIDPNKDQWRIKVFYMACMYSPGFTAWQDIMRDPLSLLNGSGPHANVTLQVRDKTTGKIIGTNSTVTPATAPDARVTSLQCTSRWCSATVDDDCRKYNGNNVTVHFTLQPSSDKLKNPLVIPVSSGPAVTIALIGLDLMPFTNYSVTASLANSAGPATDPALTKQATFITKPERPGRVSSLAVTHATPSSLHMVWTAPDDDPPKGKLIQYKLQWMAPGVPTSGSSVSVNESVTSFNITGLEPSTTYEITVSARNANTNGYGEELYITNTTKAEKPKLRFSWNESRRQDDTRHYYLVTLSDGDKSIVNNITDTEITFDGLTLGKKYKLEVKDCVAARHCYILKTLEGWTRPNMPRVIQKAERQKTVSPGTITTNLPILLNPPGMHWILMKRFTCSCSEDDNDIKQKALEMVRTEREEERKNEEKSKDTQENPGNRRSVDTKENKNSLRIVSKIEVVEGKDQEETVVVGGDWNGGDGLEGDTFYHVIVVTEKRAGPYSEYFPCKPRIMLTGSRPESTPLWMTIVTCVAGVIIIIFTPIVVVNLKEIRSVALAQKAASRQGR